MPHTRTKRSRSRSNSSSSSRSRRTNKRTRRASPPSIKSSLMHAKTAYDAGFRGNKYADFLKLMARRR